MLDPIAPTGWLLQADAARRNAEAEAANTQFRLRLARDEAARAVDELSRVLWQARRGQAFSHFVPDHIVGQYPEATFPEFDGWLDYGRDFIYRVVGDEPVLYSVGPDRSDDGGDASGCAPRDDVFLGAAADG